jgi:hypothetical protein
MGYKNLTKMFKSKSKTLDQLSLFPELEEARFDNVALVDVLHYLMGLAEAGENLIPWLNEFKPVISNIRGSFEYLLVKNPTFQVPIRCSSFMVVGIDDVLYLTKREQTQAIALDIHKVLQSAATDLEKKNIEVQIVCKGRLVNGDSLWVEYRGETFPLDFIFDTPITRENRGFPVYTVSFNLSS